MRKILVNLLYYIITSIFFPLLASAAPIEDIVHSVVQEKGDINYGFVVLDTNSKKVVASKHPKRLFTPASVTKLVTSYYALSKLGENYRYKTSLMAENVRIKNGNLSSPLYLKFSGDPTFTEENLWKLLEVLKEKKISSINANIIIDDSIFDDNWTSPGGFTWDDMPFCQAAPKSAIIIDNNCVKAYQFPTKVGNLAAIEVLRPYLLEMKNEVQTIRPRNWECPYKSKYLGKNKYLLYGCMFNDAKMAKLNFAIPDTHKMARDYIRRWFTENKIKFSGKFIFSKSKGKPIATHTSQTLRDILPLSLQDSNNLVAGAIFKTVTANITRKPASDETGSELLRDFLRKQKFNPRELKIYGGSGESNYNLISPRALAQILHRIYKDPKLFKIFAESLPEHCKNGTLKFRKCLTNHSDKIFAKSGNNKRTSTIAGYYMGQNKQYIFVVMINNHNLSYMDVKDLEGRMLEAVFNKLPT